LSGTLRDKQSSLTTEQLDTFTKELRAKITDLKSKLNGYQGQKSFSEEEVLQVKNTYNNQLKEWRVRRKACFEVIDMICDGMDKKRQEFMEENCIEDDPECGVDINTFK
jgi:hypothetical protein